MKRKHASQWHPARHAFKLARVQRYSLDRVAAFVAWIFVVGLFLPLALGGLFDGLQRPDTDDRRFFLWALSVVGFLGLGWSARFLFRPRLEVGDGALLSRTAYATRRVSLADVTALHRRTGGANKTRWDELHLALRTASRPLVIDLLLVRGADDCVQTIRSRTSAPFTHEKTSRR